MKSSVRILVLVTVLLALVAGCQESNRKSPEKGAITAVPDDQTPDTQHVQGQGGVAAGSEAMEDKASLSKIEFEKIVHDFGEVGPGTKHKCEFAFKNTGESLLRILDIVAPCGCTVPELEKMTYEPGEGGELRVEYRAQMQASNVSKYVHVVTNDKGNPKVTLTIKAKIVEKISFSPASLELLLEKEDAGIREITLESLDGKPFSIESVMSTGDCISVEFDPTAEATKFLLKATVDARKVKDGLSGHVNFSLSHPECPTVAVPFEVVPRFTVTPPAIAVIDVKPREAVRRKISVLSNYKESFEIDGIVSANGLVKMLSQEAIRDGRQFVIEISAPDSQQQVSYNRGSFSIRLADGTTLPPITYQIIYAD